eukprot:86494-Chlamydomonas_euryale.AAC.2
MGPKEITVRGLLNKEEVVMAQQTPYLHAAHIVVATPASLVEGAGRTGVRSGKDRSEEREGQEWGAGRTGVRSGKDRSEEGGSCMQRAPSSWRPPASLVELGNTCIYFLGALRGGERGCGVVRCGVWCVALEAVGQAGGPRADGEGG